MLGGGASGREEGEKTHIPCLKENGLQFDQFVLCSTMCYETSTHFFLNLIEMCGVVIVGKCNKQVY